MLFDVAASHLTEFRDNLTHIGFDDDTIAEAIRLGGTMIPVFGQQLSGCYINPSSGERTAHYAVPGWYHIVSIDGNTIMIRKLNENCWPFAFGTQFLLAVLAPNLHYVSNGLKP